ncbi:MAG: InlB B-repeat-containing protein, partial [Bacteroidales bacterium]|nr:InlB B-repeat-containing protein [Bacteroidales bacterium]
MNKHISKFLLSLTMVLGLTLGLSPTAYASEPVTEVQNFDEFVDAVANGGYVKLEADIKTGLFYALDDDITIDLNGHTLSVTWLQCNASVKIIDSSTGGNGVLICSVGGSPIIISDNGSLTLESGTLSFIGSGNAGISVREGPFTMTGGKIESACNSINLGGSNASISGGTIIGNIVGSDGEIDITGGTFSFDPSDLLKNGYTAYNSGDFWVVNAPVASVTIGDATTEYASLADALAAWDNGTLTILKDVEHTGDITILSDATLTIPEGVTLTVKGDGSTAEDEYSYRSCGAITIGENRTLHITGGGTLEVIGVDYSYDGESAIYLSGTLIVENSTVVNATGGKKTGSSSGGGGCGIHGSWTNWYNATGSNVIVDGGIVNATGGDGGNWGDGETGLYECNIIVKSGMLLATGADGSYYGAFSSATVSSGKIYQSDDGSSWAEVSGEPSAKYVKVVVAHTHNFIYSAEGATITATCSEADCPLTDSKTTLTIEAPEMTVSGSAKNPAATLTGLDVFNRATGLAVDATAIRYVYYSNSDDSFETENAPFCGGQHTAKITVEEQTASVDYEIINYTDFALSSNNDEWGTVEILNSGKSIQWSSYGKSDWNNSATQNTFDGITLETSSAGNPEWNDWGWSFSSGAEIKFISDGEPFRKIRITGEYVSSVTPGNGWVFLATNGNYQGDLVWEGNSNEVTLPDCQMSATPIIFTLGESNIVAYNTMRASVLPGTEVTVKATPVEGYVLKRWSEGVEVKDNDDGTYTLTMPKTDRLDLEAYFENAHTHNFIYSAEGATITATCSADECYLTESKATLTIAAPTNLAYNGTAKAATVENNIPDVTTAPSIVYTKDGTTIDAENVVEPGTYTATVTLADVKTGEDTTGEVTASVEFTITNNPMPVALTSSGNGGTALLLNDSYNEVNSLNKKVGEKFILRVNNDDGYNFAISFNTDDVSTTEFTSDEYKAYIEYATENNIYVPANTVLLWGTMPYIESGNLTATVTFAKTKTFTVLYQPQDGANPDVVFCKIAKTEGANEVVGYTPMNHGATMGNTVVWSLAMTSAFDPTKVAFVAANTPSTDEEKIALMTNIENEALSTAIVSQNVEWTDVTSGKYAIIGGNAKVVVASFVSDANNITTYKDNTLSEAESGDGVTYQFAVCKTDESGVVTEAGTVKVPANTLVKDGYDFAGWRGFEGTASEQTEKIYSAGDEITISENTILNAIWNRRNFTIALDLNGGTGSSSVNPVAYGTTLTIAANPTRKGYAFDGWTVGEAVTENGIYFAKGSAFDLSTPITNNLKLTAQWKHVHNYTCYKISAFGSQLEKYKKYESSLHIAVCGCDDVEVESHSFGANGKCACGLTDPSIPTTVTLDVSYGQWSNGTYTERMLEFPQEAKKNQEVSIDAPHNWGNLQFSKWQYSTNNGASWYDLTAYEIVSFIIPCSMKVRALYVNPVTAPTVELNARQYDDLAEVNGKTYTMDNILFQMNYKLPDGYTFVDGGIKMGDNNGISYYNIQEVKVSYDNECKGIIAGMGAALGAVSFFTSGGWDAISSFNEVASHMNDKATTYNYVETEENVLNKMDATQLAKCMYKGTPINVEKYSPIYWVANAKTKSMSGSMATLPPLRFAQKNNGNHYIYGIGWMTFKTRSGAIYTIYTDALAATINNIPTKSVKKAAPINIGTVGYDNESEEGKLDMSLVFVPETQLNVYVDGEWSADLSGSYGFGDKATISAPEVSGKTFSYWEADGRPVSSSNPLTLTMNAHTTLRAVYDGSAVSAKVGFTSITRINDKISFQAIADAQATAVGIIYSTTATGDALTLNGEGVIQAAAERLTDATTTMPASVLDDNNCWMLKIAPEDENTIYHARVYATIDGTTIYSDVRDVKLADLQSGVRRIANLDGFVEGIDEALTELLKSGEAVARYSVTVSGT